MNIIAFPKNKNNNDNNRVSAVYTVYAYRDPTRVCGQYNAWEMMAAKACPNEALKCARELYAHKDYEKIEVYKRYYCAKTQKIRNKLYKTLGENSFWNFANFWGAN